MLVPRHLYLVLASLRLNLQLDVYPSSVVCAVSEVMSRLPAIPGPYRSRRQASQFRCLQRRLLLFLPKIIRFVPADKTLSVGAFSPRLSGWVPGSNSNVLTFNRCGWHQDSGQEKVFSLSHHLPLSFLSKLPYFENVRDMKRIIRWLLSELGIRSLAGAPLLPLPCVFSSRANLIHF